MVIPLPTFVSCSFTYWSSWWRFAIGVTWLHWETCGLQRPLYTVVVSTMAYRHRYLFCWHSLLQGWYVGTDLAHAIDNIKLHLTDWGVDFACWCNYKYVSGGPIGVSGFYIDQRHADNFDLLRWLEHTYAHVTVHLFYNFCLNWLPYAYIPIFTALCLQRKGLIGCIPFFLNCCFILFEFVH